MLLSASLQPGGGVATRAALTRCSRIVLSPGMPASCLQRLALSDTASGAACVAR